MTKHFLLTVFAVFTFQNFAISQKVRNSVNKFTKVIVYDQNGEKKEGLGKIPGGKFPTYFKFKLTKDSKAIKMSPEIVSKVMFFTKGGWVDQSTVYRFVRTSSRSKPNLMQELIEEGQAGLYLINYTKIESRGTNSSGMKKQELVEKSMFFVKKKDETFAEKIKMWNLKKQFIKYFNDCPILVEKLENGDFKLNSLLKKYIEMRRVVSFYNSKCE